LCNKIDPDAARAKSVNTIVAVGSETAGFSTDIDGIRACWETLPSDRPVLILGTGGAAAAAVVALAEYEPYIAGRRFGVGAEIAAATGVELGEVHWGVPVVGAVVVNCTPLGMSGESLPDAVLELADGLFDMAYASEPTPAISRMRKAGKPTVDGRQLLVAQAGFGFRIFTGIDPPLPAMQAAVENP
jgi:shikimate dehydrogenase